MKQVSASLGCNKTFSSFKHDHSTTNESIAWYAALALETALIVAANLLTIVLFAVNKNLHKKSLYLVINMALADLMVGIGCSPFYLYYAVRAYSFQLVWTKNLQTPLGRLFSAMNVIFSAASEISAALISFERFFAIYWPLKHRTLSIQTYRIVIFISWASAIVCSTILIVLFNGNFIPWESISYFFSIYLLSLVVIVCGCNIAIWRKFKQTNITAQLENRTLQHKRLIKTLLFVSTFALISWFPVAVLSLLDASLIMSPTIYPIGYILSYSNSLFNPFIYALRIPEFRKTLAFSSPRNEGQRRGAKECNEKEDIREIALTLVTQRTEQEEFDTKLWYLISKRVAECSHCQTLFPGSSLPGHDLKDFRETFYFCWL